MLHTAPSTTRHTLRAGLLKTASSLTSAPLFSTRCGASPLKGARKSSKGEPPASPVTLDSPHTKPCSRLSVRVAVPEGVVTVSGAPQSSAAAEGRARAGVGAGAEGAEGSAKLSCWRIALSGEPTARDRGIEGERAAGPAGELLGDGSRGEA